MGNGMGRLCAAALLVVACHPSEPAPPDQTGSACGPDYPPGFYCGPTGKPAAIAASGGSELALPGQVMVAALPGKDEAIRALAQAGGANVLAADVDAGEYLLGIAEGSERDLIEALMKHQEDVVCAELNGITEQPPAEPIVNAPGFVQGESDAGANVDLFVVDELGSTNVCGHGHGAAVRYVAAHAGPITPVVLDQSRGGTINTWNIAQSVNYALAAAAKQHRNVVVNVSSGSGDAGRAVHWWTAMGCFLRFGGAAGQAVVFSTGNGYDNATRFGRDLAVPAPTDAGDVLSPGILDDHFVLVGGSGPPGDGGGAFCAVDAGVNYSSMGKVNGRPALLYQPDIGVPAGPGNCTVNGTSFAAPRAAARIADAWNQHPEQSLDKLVADPFLGDAPGCKIWVGTFSYQFPLAGVWPGPTCTESGGTYPPATLGGVDYPGSAAIGFNGMTFASHDPQAQGAASGNVSFSPPLVHKYDGADCGAALADAANYLHFDAPDTDIDLGTLKPAGTDGTLDLGAKTFTNCPVVVNGDGTIDVPGGFGGCDLPDHSYIGFTVKPQIDYCCPAQGDCKKC